MTSEEIEILELIRRGSEDGLRRLIVNIAPRVEVALLRKFGQPREDMIRDAITDSALELVEKIDRFDEQRDGASLIRFLFGFARNRLLNAIRSSQIGPELIDGHRIGEVADDRDGRWERTTDQTSRFDRLWKAIGELSAMQRSIVLHDMWTGSDQTDADLALAFDSTVGSIQSSRLKAKKRIGQLMGGVDHGR